MFFRIEKIVCVFLSKRRRLHQLCRISGPLHQVRHKVLAPFSDIKGRKTDLLFPLNYNYVTGSRNSGKHTGTKIFIDQNIYHLPTSFLRYRAM